MSQRHTPLSKTISKMYRILLLYTLLTCCNCCAVVSQPYVTETHNTYVINGNSALFKCEIPSFVADFVSVEGWVDGDGQEFFAQSGHGNFRRPAHTFVALRNSYVCRARTRILREFGWPPPLARLHFPICYSDITALGIWEVSL